MTQAIQHPFDHLGQPPYAFIGVVEKIHYPCTDLDGNPDSRVPPVACGTCDHCGTCIRYAYKLKSSDGKQFEVGCDCILKADKEPKLVRIITEERRKIERENRLKREEAKIADLTPQYEAIICVLEKSPHPNEYYAGQGKTLADYYSFILRSCGNAGTIKYMKLAIAKAKAKET